MADTPEPVTTEPAADMSDPLDSGRPQMAVKVYAPFRVYYDGVGEVVSAVNEVGPFDILPHHRNFLCMLKPCDVKIQTPEGEKVIPITKALMHVKADRVVIFVDV